MYKVQNSDLDDDHKGIFIAAGGLYEIIKNERILLAVAGSFKANDVEKSFNEIVAAAVENYTTFTAEASVTGSQLDAELVTNFSEFFDLIIDIKKKEVDAAAGDNVHTE